MPNRKAETQAVSCGAESPFPGPPEAGRMDRAAEPPARGEHGRFLAGYTPTPTQRARRFQPGKSGNPAGRRKADPGLREVLTAGSVTAALALCDIVNDPGINPRVRCMAAEIILARVCGKALQPIDSAPGEVKPIVVEFKGVLDDWAG